MSDQNSHSPVEILFPDPSDFSGIHISYLPDYLNCHRLKIENNVLRSDVGYWKSCYQRAVEREKHLKQTIEELEANVNLRERQLFGRKQKKAPVTMNKMTQTAP
jgi:hypothetical protein